MPKVPSYLPNRLSQQPSETPKIVDTSASVDIADVSIVRSVEVRDEDAVKGSTKRGNDQDSDGGEMQGIGKVDAFSADTLAGSKDQLAKGQKGKDKSGVVKSLNFDEDVAVEVLSGGGIVDGDVQPYKFKTGLGRKRRSKFYVEFRNWMVNDGPSDIFLIIWITINAINFGTTFTYYQNSPDYFTFRRYLGYSLFVARGAAANLNVSCAILLLPWHLGVPAPETIAILSGPGATGQIMVLCLFLIATSSVSQVRRKFFEFFYFTHHLGIIFFICLILHGNFCFIQADTAPVCRGPVSWKYVVAACGVYFIERGVRSLRSRFQTRIKKVVQHPGRVVEVQIVKPSCKMRPGQYIFLCCPEISRTEWHPFTLTSAPEENFISVHIRMAGDWTETFANRLGCKWDDKELAPKLGEEAIKALPFVMVDGPYGAASEDVFNYPVSILVGAGIGVTPFASVLKSIWYAFEWFQDLLQALEAENLDNYMSFNIYYTGNLKADEVSNIMINQTDEIDALTGLRTPTIYGRPNLDAIFKKMNEDHPNIDIGVFFCGPKPLGKNLHKMCNKYTSVDEDGTRFYYHKGELSF
ncbi:hypothetical protein HDU76_008760 [Blyttiomyces sp. JEL0837]|nr:hypothetical protein HDU76_008760 [Blyttiomyces sp. JEL0837]